jgi:predicted TIM-barrel fold metal-dependent hydrolase
MIIDSHVHVFPPSFRDRREELIRRDATFRELYSNPKAVLATVEDLMEAMDAAEVDAAVAVGIGWSDIELAREANDHLAEAVSRSNGRLIGSCAVNPAWGDDALAEVERCAAAGLTGIGELHPDTQGFSIEDAKTMTPLMALAKRLNLPVVAHASEPVGHTYQGKGTVTPERLLSFIEAFPDQPIIAAHWGGGLPFYALMPEVNAALANTYFDTAASPFLYDAKVFSTATGLVGADKILFGTDYPLIKHPRLLEQVRQSGLSLEDQARITGGNIARLLGLGS